MGGDVIKSFLVGLGFDVDDSSLSKFNKSLASATLKVTALAAAVEATAGAIVFGVAQISDSFEKMGYELHILSPSINKAIILRQELFKAYSSAGVSIVKAAQAAQKLNLSFAKTKIVLDSIYKSVGYKFFGLLQKQSDLFRLKLYQNMPKIQMIMEKFVNFIFKAFEAITRLGERVWSLLTRAYDFFIQLDQATDGWSTVILGVLAAWKLLNLGFLATPLGMLITGFTVLLALWDDFKTFREGGQSLINWGSDFTKTLVGLVAAIGGVVAIVYAGKVAMAAYAAGTKAVIAIQELWNGILTITDGLLLIMEAPIWLIVGAIAALVAALTLADSKWQIFGGHLSGFFGGIGSKLMNFIGGTPNVGANTQNNPGNTPMVNPVGSGANTTNTNQNVNQQTNINVVGSSDAQSVGKNVAGQQNRVNFDMTRNLKGYAQ